MSTTITGRSAVVRAAARSCAAAMSARCSAMAARSDSIVRRLPGWTSPLLIRDDLGLHGHGRGGSTAGRWRAGLKVVDNAADGGERFAGCNEEPINVLS